MELKNFSYTIEKAIGVISEHGNTRKELNLVSYNGAPARYDLRSWDRTPGQAPKMYKGLTLTEEEATLLFQLLKKELQI